MIGTRLSRRSALALTSGFILAGIGLPASAAEVGSGANLVLVQSSGGPVDGFESPDGGIMVEWDDALYQVNQDISSDIAIYLNDGRRHGYTFDARYSNHPWPNDPTSVDLAIEEWFSLGMAGVDIVEKWSAEDSFAFFFTSDYGDYRGMRYFEYRYDDSLMYPWINANFSCDVGPEGKDVSRTAEYLEGVTLNGAAFPMVTDADELVSLIESHNL